MLDYKYKVGDYVKFKTNSTERAGTVARITGFAPPFNKPHYYINGLKNEIFPETVFERLAKMSDFSAEARKDPLFWRKFFDES